MIALSICLIGFRYILSKNFLKYLFCIVLAMTFHTTAIVVLPIYWIKNINLKNKFLIFALMEVLCVLFSRKIIMLSLKLFSSYSGYINSVYDIQGGSYIMLFVLNIIFLFAYYKFYIRNEKFNNITDMSIKVIMVAILLQCLAYSMGIFGRIVPYYSIYLIILIPDLMRVSLENNKILVHFLIVFVLIVIFYILTKGSQNLDPYKFIWMQCYLAC